MILAWQAFWDGLTLILELGKHATDTAAKSSGEGEGPTGPLLVGLVVTLASSCVATFALWLLGSQGVDNFDDAQVRVVQNRMLRDFDAVQACAGIIAVTGASLTDRGALIVNATTTVVCAGVLILVITLALLAVPPVQYRRFTKFIFTPLTAVLSVSYSVALLLVR